jgi:hypothetical protein
MSLFCRAGLGAWLGLLVARDKRRGQQGAGEGDGGSSDQRGVQATGEGLVLAAAADVTTAVLDILSG